MSGIKYAPCTTDLDCAGNLICFNANVTQWVKNEIGYSFCGCTASRWFVGDTCTDPHPSEHLILAYFAAHFMGAIICFLASSIALWRLFQVSRLARGEITLQTPIVHTAILCLSQATLSLIGNSLGVMCDNQTTTYIILYDKYKACTQSVAIIVITGLTLLVGFLALLNVSITWIDMVMKVKAMQTASSGWSKKLIYVIRLLELTFLAVVIGTLSTLNLELAGAMLIPFGLLVIALYAVAGIKLANIIKSTTSFYSEHATPAASSSNNDNTNLRNALVRVQITVWGVTTTIFAAIVFLVTSVIIAPAGGLAYEHEGWDKPGQFCQLAAFICALFNVLFIQWFVWKSAMGTVARLERKATSNSGAKSSQHHNGMTTTRAGNMDMVARAAPSSNAASVGN